MWMKGLLLALSELAQCEENWPLSADSPSSVIDPLFFSADIPYDERLLWCLDPVDVRAIGLPGTDGS
ncbi:MAG: hypothetical protein AMXMBFR13_21900 [Phycisphaerae bacterium]